MSINFDLSRVLFFFISKHSYLLSFVLLNIAIIMAYNPFLSSSGSSPQKSLNKNFVLYLHFILFQVILYFTEFPLCVFSNTFVNITHNNGCRGLLSRGQNLEIQTQIHL